MNTKELSLDIEALISETLYGHGFLHYGYWPDGQATMPSLESLGKAQQAYFERMAAMIPDATRTILDVGSGTGSNARALIDRGYVVDCLCPSPRLNIIAREKLKGNAEIFECRFEDFESDRQYDLILCCESFHYIHAVHGLRQAGKYANSHLLIFDYFRRQEGSLNDRITYRQFLAHVQRSAFTILHDEDVTAAILPTFIILDDLKNNYLKPFAARLLADYRKEHPVYAVLLAKLLKRLEKSVLKPANRSMTFSANHEYRLILLEKRAGFSVAAPTGELQR